MHHLLLKVEATMKPEAEREHVSEVSPTISQDALMLRCTDL